MTGFAMPRIADIVARIAAQVDGFETVGHLLGLDAAALLATPSALPAALVAPLPPGALPGELLSTVHGQTVDWRCGVYVILPRRLPDADDEDDEGSAGDWDDLVADLRVALAGWAPPGEGARMRWIGGQLEQIAPGLLAWRDDYECRRLLRHTPPT